MTPRPAVEDGPIGAWLARPAAAGHHGSAMNDTARPGRLVLLIVILLLGAALIGVAASWRGTPGPSMSAAAPTAPATAAATAAATLGSLASAPPSGRAGSSSTPGAGAPSGLGSPAASGERNLAELLAMLVVSAETRAGYERTLFPHWIDADKNGCDTRDEVLIAEAIARPTLGAGCSLTGGRWLSPYDGLETTVPTTLDIDHLVPLAEAWDSGAGAWTTERRRLYANDLGVDWGLVAVTGSVNRSKGDQDPAQWLPPLASFKCAYEGMWLAVKVRWALAIDATERATLAAGIAGCSNRMPVVIAP